MNARLALVVFGLLCAAQLALPAAMLDRHQRALAEGAAYRFKTRPVDPADPFRGRYVALDFEAACAGLPAGEAISHRRRYYAPLAVGTDGYATLGALSRQRPAGDYIVVRVRRGWRCDGGERLELPFDRYYLPEELAPQAERAYAQANRRRGVDDEDGRVPAYASVRVRDGYAALEELYLDGLAIPEYLHRHAP